MAGPVTLSQVAREAGVSLATASRAINGSPTRAVRADLRDRVLAAAERLRYSPDANAQAMARGRTTAVGLVVPDIADPRVAAVAAGVCAAADRAGLTVTLASTARDPEREHRVVQALTRQRARGIVLVGGPRDDPDADAALGQALADFRAGGGSVTLVGGTRPGVDTVVVDDRAGAAALARAVHGRGYRRFAVLGGPPDDPVAQARRDGFAEALTALGVAPVPGALVACEPDLDGGHDGMARLLAAHHDVDAVLAVTDAAAAGAVAAARRAGVRVPDDVAVAGCGDVTGPGDPDPGLSTVRVPLGELGVAATELALTPGGGAPRVVRVVGTVVLRGSTPPR